MSRQGEKAPADTAAVVLTHRRPRLATRLVRSLLDEEGFTPDRIHLVIDRDGGLDDPALEASLSVLRTTTNAGPAAGFRAGLAGAFAHPGTAWVYMCEDDVLLSGLPTPRVADVRRAIDARNREVGREPGAVVAYGRRFRPGRGGTTLPFVPERDTPRLQRVDVAAWGATLVSRQVYDSGVRPDDRWFFGYEDFDFFLTVQRAGFEVLVDAQSALATADHAPDASASGAARPGPVDEPWRSYYVARNFFELARRHGDWSWAAWHLLLTARRFQLAGDATARRAIAHGLVDGLRGRRGRHPRWVRSVGEWDAGRSAG